MRKDKIIEGTIKSDINTMSLYQLNLFNEIIQFIMARNSLKQKTLFITKLFITVK